MKFLIILLAIIAAGVQAATYSVNTKISKVRTVSEFDSTTLARGHVPFKVAEPLQGGCTWLYLTPENKNTYSLLLAAKLADKVVGIKYSDAPSPWHAGTCQVHYVDLD
jgi:hypothetical protein